MSARAVAVIRPAPSIISLPAFLYILSGKASCTLLGTNLVVHCEPWRPEGVDASPRSRRRRDERELHITWQGDAYHCAHVTR